MESRIIPLRLSNSILIEIEQIQKAAFFEKYLLCAIFNVTNIVLQKVFFSLPKIALVHILRLRTYIRIHVSCLEVLVRDSKRVPTHWCRCTDTLNNTTYWRSLSTICRTQSARDDVSGPLLVRQRGLFPAFLLSTLYVSGSRANPPERRDR